jgi:hypothetical protein
MEIREEGQAMSEVTRRLQAKFPDARPDVVDAVVQALHHEFDGDPIRDFVPVLVEREAVARLTLSTDPRSHAPV